MKNYIYGISEEKYALGNASRTSYGIVAYADSEKNGTASIVASVNDITDDKDKLSAFADACNRIRKRYACKRRATRECSITDTCNRIWNCYIYK